LWEIRLGLEERYVIREQLEKNDDDVRVIEVHLSVRRERERLL